MHNVVKEITNKYVSRLPEHEEYLFPEELARYGIPDFVVERVRFELKNNLIQSLIIPETDWADMKDEQIEAQWNVFLEEIAENVRLPMSYGGSVFENCIDDIISVLSEPRTYITELLFGERADLFRQEIVQRAQGIVVFSHLAQAILRFMQKKELDTISRERANQVVARIDDRLTEHFSPLNWAQHLDPLFIMTDNKVDPDLIRCFFEDKEKTNWANRFDRESELVTRSRFIEILSAPDANYYNEEPEEPVETVEDISNASEEKSLAESFNEEDVKQKPLVERFNKKENNLAEAFLQAQQALQEESEINSKIGELSADRFFASEESELQKEAEEEKAEEVQQETEAKDAPEVKEEESEESEVVSGENKQETAAEIEEEKSEVTTPTEAAEESEPDIDVPEESEDAVPIWKRFAVASSEDDNILKKYDHSDDGRELSQTKKSLAQQLAEENEPDEYNEKPIIDLVNDQEKSEESDPFDLLYHYVEDQENRFTDEIFGGDNNSFTEALKMIAEFESWSKASKYISSEIFRRNMINIYSESAIDFTDRLQTYFIEKK